MLLPAIGRAVFPSKFLKPSNEPRAGLLHSRSHGDLLVMYYVVIILQRKRNKPSFRGANILPKKSNASLSDPAYRK
jgi:hypothetical protein